MPWLDAPAAGVGWGDDDDEKRTKSPLLLAIALVLGLVGASMAAPAHRSEAVGVIVRSLDGTGHGIVDSLLSRPGALPLPLIDGVAIELDAATAANLARSGAVSVTEDRSIQLTSFESGPPSHGGALHRINDVVGATSFWGSGFTGSGVDVAVIDSGIAPVPGLDDPAKVVNGYDVSFDTISGSVEPHLDLFGHGTHMASIIAGSDLGIDQVPNRRDLRSSYVGVAPGARLVNVKVADGRGLADVSQVIASIGWVVEHGQGGPHGLDVRVLALAFGTDGTQDPAIDPLAYAVEQAWDAGIVVVASAGNDGSASEVRNPALHPKVVVVGAADSKGTRPSSDDSILAFSNCGIARNVDLVAPGLSVLGLRVPGSYIDAHNPSAVVQGRLFLGSGTSQAAAVVAGAAALVIDQRPDATPDEVKAVLMQSASPLKRTSGACQGSGMLDLRAAIDLPTPVADQGPSVSDGSGSLEASRGSIHVVIDGNVLEGEIDIFGEDWAGQSWSGQSWSGQSWSGQSWSGQSWSGQSWSSDGWSGQSWSGQSWSGQSWSGQSWSGQSWSGQSWSGQSWSGQSWSGQSWSGVSWSTHRWG